MYEQAQQIREIIDASQKLLIVQADNPDSDSLGSALALEHILGDLGKEPILYCAVDMPTYIRYLSGWDRVSAEFPSDFDASIIVDVSTLTLLEKLEQSNHISKLANKPCIVLDHHQIVDNQINFATITINDPKRAGVGELIYLLAKDCGWNVSDEAATRIMAAILGDTQGLTNELATADTYRLLAEMIDAGVSRPQLEDRRRDYSKMPNAIFRYKADLIKRTEFTSDNRIAHVRVPQNEINEFSPLYNPAPLIQADMLQTEGVDVAIVFKTYSDGKVTAAIRCNSRAPIAAYLASEFGGGGHKQASGFKVTDGRSFEDIKNSCLQKASSLISNEN